MIHVNTHNAEFAATTVLDVLDKHPVPWLVWSAGDEGLCMAPDDGRTARSIRKYWSAQIVGCYQHGVTHAQFVRDIGGRWFSKESMTPKEVAPRPGAGRPPSAKHVAAVRILSACAMSADQLATALGISVDRAKNVTDYLMKNKRARSRRTWSASRRRYIAVYEAVA